MEVKNTKYFVLGLLSNVLSGGISETDTTRTIGWVENGKKYVVFSV